MSDDQGTPSDIPSPDPAPEPSQSREAAAAGEGGPQAAPYQAPRQEAPPPRELTQPLPRQGLLPAVAWVALSVGAVLLLLYFGVLRWARHKPVAKPVEASAEALPPIAEAEPKLAVKKTEAPRPEPASTKAVPAAAAVKPAATAPMAMTPKLVAEKPKAKPKPKPAAKPLDEGVVEPPLYFRPGKKDLSVHCWRPEGGEAMLEVFGAKNQKLRTLRSAAGPAGWQDLSWDGKDEAGKALEPGSYFLRPSTEKSQVVWELRLL